MAAQRAVKVNGTGILANTAHRRIVREKTGILKMQKTLFIATHNVSIFGFVVTVWAKSGSWGIAPKSRSSAIDSFYHFDGANINCYRNNAI